MFVIESLNNLRQEKDIDGNIKIFSGIRIFYAISLTRPYSRKGGRRSTFGSVLNFGSEKLFSKVGMHFTNSSRRGAFPPRICNWLTAVDRVNDTVKFPWPIPLSPVHLPNPNDAVSRFMQRYAVIKKSTNFNNSVR